MHCHSSDKKFDLSTITVRSFQMQEWDHLLGLDPPSSTSDQKCTFSAYLCWKKVLSGPATLYMMLASKAPTLKRHPLHPYHNTLLKLQKKAKNTDIPHITNRQSELRHCYFTPDSIQPELQRSHQMSIQYAWLRLKLQVSKTQVIQFFSSSKPAITSKLRAEREGKQ